MPLYPLFWGEGLNRLPKKVGTLILTSLPEDLENHGSTFPSTRQPLWVHIFDPQPHQTPKTAAAGRRLRLNRLRQLAEVDTSGDPLPGPMPSALMWAQWAQAQQASRVMLDAGARGAGCGEGRGGEGLGGRGWEGRGWEGREGRREGGKEGRNLGGKERGWQGFNLSKT